MQAKTKVAPIKKILTISKLELCAVLLLAKLVNKINSEMKLANYTYRFWTNFNDILYWLGDHPSKWSAFIANSSSKVHELNSACVSRDI